MPKGEFPKYLKINPFFNLKEPKIKVTPSGMMGEAESSTTAKRLH